MFTSGRSGWKGFAIVGMTASLTLPANAQQRNPSQQPVGAGLSPTLKLKELTSEWRYVGIQPVGPANDSGEMLKQLMQLGMMAQAGEKGKGGQGGEAALGMAMMSSLFGGMFGGGASAKPIQYTRGQTVAVGSETFLVTYRFQPQQNGLMELALKAGGENKAPDAENLLGGSLKEDSELSLTLVNVRSIGELTDFRPFDLKRELELQAKAAGGGLMELFAQGFKEGFGGAAGAEGGGAEGVVAAEPEDPTAAVRKALAEDVALKKAPNRFTVKMEDGTIVLRGTATSRFMQERAALIAEQALDRLPGIYFFESKLTVRAPGRK